MKLATTTGDFSAYAATQEECIAHIAKTDFRYLDYNFGMDYNRKIGIYGADPKKHLESVLHTAEENGMRFVQAHSPMGKPLAEDNGAFIEDTIKCVYACKTLGIPNLVVHSGYLPGLSVEETFALNKVFYRPLLSAAEECGVNILVENFNKMHVEGLYWIDNAPDLLALIEYVDHPLFHAVWDVGHANMQEMPQDEALRLLGKHVYALHVQDNLGNSDAHMAPFFGSTSLDAVMHGLLDIGYDGYFTFESGNIFLPTGKKRPYDADKRLLRAPLSLRLKAEQFLYEIGKCVLEAYDVYER